MDRVERINNLPLWDIDTRRQLDDFPSINDKADKNHTHDEYMTREEMADKYATLIYINSEISKIIELIDNIDLSHLVKKSELENKKYLTSVPDEYITESELNNMGFLTKQQDISAYATITYIDAEIAALKKWVEDNYAKKTELDTIRTRLENLEIEINKLKQDLEDMKAEVDSIKPIITYSVTYNLTSVTSTKTITSIIENNSYNTVLSCASDYDFSNVTVTMNGVDITNSVVTTSATDERTINISNVTGNIVITATAKKVAKVYSITYNLSGCTSTNKTSNLTGENNSYSTTINPNSGYKVNSIKVTMGGTNITNDVVSDNYIYISNVTGNIVITATAKSTNVPCTGVSFNISSQSIAIGQIFSLHGHISVSPSNCTDEIETWSDDHSIARVSGYSVHGESAGSTTIYVQCGDYTDSCTIYVS